MKNNNDFVATETGFTRKGKIMRKIISSIILTIIVVTLSGCSYKFKLGQDHATVSVSISDGRSGIWQSKSRKGSAMRNYTRITLKKGETAKIRFECDACGYVEDVVVDEPFAKCFKCKCPTTWNKSGETREYAAITISYEKK